MFLGLVIIREGYTPTGDLGGKLLPRNGNGGNGGNFHRSAGAARLWKGKG